MIGKAAVFGLVSLLGLSALAWRQPVRAPSHPTPAASPSGAGPSAVRTAAVPVQAKPMATGGGMLPERLLTRRIEIGDPAEPPRSTLPPEPVDPRTRIVADPDGIAAGAAAKPFERVVDYWPERVEMTTPIGNGLVNLIILQRSQTKPGLIDLFMTRATDAVSWDEKHLYSGHCKIREQGAG